ALARGRQPQRLGGGRGRAVRGAQAALDLGARPASRPRAERGAPVTLGAARTRGPCAVVSRRRCAPTSAARDVGLLEEALDLGAEVLALEGLDHDGVGAGEASGLEGGGVAVR